MESRKLDVGCGNTITPGYERLDIDKRYPNLDYVAELDHIPVADGSFGELRASHVIEHVPLHRVRATVLREWLRVLEPDGRLWIDTPNIERNAILYVDDDWLDDFHSLTAEEQADLMWGGVPDRDLWINFKIFSTETQWNTHYWNAAPDLMMKLLGEAGFTRIRVLQTEPSLITEAYRPG